MAFPVLVELGIDQEVLDLINQERAKVGINPVNDNDDIDDAADRQAFDMAQNNNFSEIGTDGSTVDSRVADTNYPFSHAGEVIAFGQKTPAEAVAQWMNDPVQRNTLLDPTFTDAALGSVANTDGNVYWVETFGGPDVAPTPAPVAPAPMTATADPLPVDPMVAVDPTLVTEDPMVVVDPTLVTEDPMVAVDPTLVTEDPMVAVDPTLVTAFVDPIMTATADPLAAPTNDPIVNVDITGGVTTVGSPTDLQPSPDPVFNNPVVDPNPIVMQMSFVPQDTNNSNTDPIYSGQCNRSRHQSHDRMGAPDYTMGDSDLMGAHSRHRGRHH